MSKESTQLRRTGVVLEGPPVQYSTKRVLSGEREQEQCRWRRCEEVYNHALSSSEVEWILIHSIHHSTSQYLEIQVFISYSQHRSACVVSPLPDNP